MRSYVAPALTRIGSFAAVTKSLGHAPQHDIFRKPALIVIWPS